jgi:hypothetical protein
MIVAVSAKKLEQRRPLIIRKNNFISTTTSNQTDEQDRSLNRTVKVQNLQSQQTQKSVDKTGQA